MENSLAKRSFEQYRPYRAHWQQRQIEAQQRLQKHHQLGLAKAKELADLLKADFGATKVVLFGSMRSIGSIHLGSDIDLAVWDLPIQDYFAALGQMLMQSEGFDVDLVCVETAPLSLKRHILKEGWVLDSDIPDASSLEEIDMPTRSYIVLIGRIQRLLEELQAEYGYAQTQAEAADKTQQAVYWMAVSLSLQSFYTGLEKIFEQIAREVDGHLETTSEQWHKTLLEQMSLEIPGIRAAVIDQPTYDALKKCLAFRHVVRSHYSHRLDPEQIATNFQVLKDCYRQIDQQLREFCRFLASVES
jgi:predicted nucleotidyltransferase